ncbi:hypothetical protein AB0J86_20720 [Micromonospora sp. NPDC049559]|uniref:hypothetical protein n=1 Tax=Micromonospora sp. NPDC049559 TaxID=3155923 RepID=UPI00341AF8CC
MRIGIPDQNHRPPGHSRRAVLRAGALASVTAVTAPLAGCDLFDGSDERDRGPDPLAGLVTGALDLAARHEAAAAAFPDLAARLTPIAQAHRAHAAELARVIATPLPSGAPTVPAGGAETDDRATLAALRKAEQRGQEEATRLCVDAPASRAALVGSIAAARATHAEVLR